MIYEAPMSAVEVMKADIPAGSGGPIILPDDDFND